MKKRSIILCLLNFSILFSTAQPLFAATETPSIPNVTLVPQTTAATVAGAFLEAIKSGILTSVGGLSSAVRKFNYGWKQFDKAMPLVSAAIVSVIVTATIKLILSNMKKGLVQSLPDEGTPGFFKKLLQEKDEKEKNKKFWTERRPKATLASLSEGKLPERIQELVDRAKGIKLTKKVVLHVTTKKGGTPKEVIVRKINPQSIRPILFHGSPAAGKSTCADVFASEIGGNVTVLETTGSAFLSKYVGQAAKNALKLIDRAKQLANPIFRLPLTEKKKVVIIIDELLSIASGTTGDNQYGWALIETLQNAFDKIFPSTEIFLVATTNSTKLPAALLSRFSAVYFEPIKLEKIIERLRFLLRNKLIADKIIDKKDITEDFLDICIDESGAKDTLKDTQIENRSLENICANTTSIIASKGVEVSEALKEGILREKVALQERHNSQEYTNYYKHDDKVHKQYLELFEQLLSANDESARKVILKKIDDFAKEQDLKNKEKAAPKEEKLDILKASNLKTKRKKPKTILKAVSDKKEVNLFAGSIFENVYTRVEKEKTKEKDAKEELEEVAI